MFPIKIFWESLWILWYLVWNVYNLWLCTTSHSHHNIVCTPTYKFIGFRKASKDMELWFSSIYRGQSAWWIWFIIQVLQKQEVKALHFCFQCSAPTIMFGDSVPSWLKEPSYSRIGHVGSSHCFVCHISDILGSNFLLHYASRWLISSNNVYFFLQKVGEIFDKNSSIYGQLFDQCLPVIYMNHGYVRNYVYTHHRFARFLKRSTYRKVKEYWDFWWPQSLRRCCALCSKRITSLATFSGAEAEVQLTPCCYTICHLKCICDFMLQSMSCSHGCRKPLDCFLKHGQSNVLGTFKYCNTCNTCFYKGLIDVDFEDHVTTIKRRTLRQSNDHNEKLLNDHQEWYIYPIFERVHRLCSWMFTNLLFWQTTLTKSKLMAVIMYKGIDSIIGCYFRGSMTLLVKGDLTKLINIVYYLRYIHLDVWCDLFSSCIYNL